MFVEQGGRAQASSGASGAFSNQGAPVWAQYGQDCYIDHILSAKRGGFFVEIGANDGELHSNTLFFERVRGWQGLLVEPNPFTFAQVHGLIACARET